MKGKKRVRKTTVQPAAAPAAPPPGQQPDTLTDAAGSRAQLAAAAASLDAELAAGNQPPVTPIGVTPAAPAAGLPAVVDYDQEARELVDFAWAAFEPLYPSLATVYTADKRERITTAAAPLMRKYGFTLDKFFKGWAAEIGFAMVTVPLIAPTIKAIRADQARMKAEAAAAQTTAQPAVKPAGAAPAPTFKITPNAEPL